MDPHLAVPPPVDPHAPIGAAYAAPADAPPPEADDTFALEEVDEMNQPRPPAEANQNEPVENSSSVWKILKTVVKNVVKYTPLCILAPACDLIGGYGWAERNIYDRGGGTPTAARPGPRPPEDAANDRPPAENPNALQIGQNLAGAAAQPVARPGQRPPPVPPRPGALPPGALHQPQPAAAQPVVQQQPPPLPPLPAAQGAALHPQLVAANNPPAVDQAAQDAAAEAAAAALEQQLQQQLVQQQAVAGAAAAPAADDELPVGDAEAEVADAAPADTGIEDNAGPPGPPQEVLNDDAAVHQPGPVAPPPRAEAPAAADPNELSQAIHRLKPVPKDAAKGASTSGVEALKEAAQREAMKSTKGSIQDRIAAANAQIDALRNNQSPPNT